jgi:sigma54-dependent transcription regulator
VPLTSYAWYDAVRKGRTFATDGPLIDFRIEGAPIGSVLSVSPGTEVEILAKAMTNAFNPGFERLDVYANGELVRSQPFGPNDTDRTVQLSFRQKVARNTWFVFVARQRDRAVAISSPIYVDLKR